MHKLNANTFTCETSLRGKQLAFASDMPKRWNDALKVVHSNIYGPFEVLSLGGSKYFITFVNEHTWMLWLYIVKFKSEVPQFFKKFKNLI